jgi:lipopolysaccharide/colanic/teichoic acid biosynthesis glycosyltransferase
MTRVRDILVALAVLVVTAPLVAAVAAAVRLDIGAPVLFRQRRIGLGGRPFTLYKFRTMRDGAGDDDARLTRLGRALRVLSLDELPQFWNVLRGDMSLIGPRPLLPQYLDRYTPEQARRHEVRPGITGLAQVLGRNGLSWEERFALDVQYVDRHGLGLDVWILYRTIVVVVGRQGVSAAGHATMPEFQGRHPARGAPDPQQQDAPKRWAS